MENGEGAHKERKTITISLREVEEGMPVKVVRLDYGKYTSRIYRGTVTGISRTNILLASHRGPVAIETKETGDFETKIYRA